MRADILIVGQGLAGTVLGWQLEGVGISFAIVDCGHEGAATRAAAGLVNPITGRRLVKSWRVEEALPFAREFYRELEKELEVELWRELRMRRLFADDVERRIWREKRANGELAPFASEQADENGFWIDGAARVDLGRLLTKSRERWRAQRILREGEVDLATEQRHYARAIDCRGWATTRDPLFRFVPWEYSKGEVLELAVDFPADVALNRRHWVVAGEPGVACIGATHEPGKFDATPTAAARATLEASAQELLTSPFEIIGQRAGVRVNLPDKRPVAGVHPEHPRVGVLNGLGAKGTLLAPILAQQWTKHLKSGAPFSAEVDVQRFWRHNSSQALAL